MSGRAFANRHTSAVQGSFVAAAGASDLSSGVPAANDSTVSDGLTWETLNGVPVCPQRVPVSDVRIDVVSR
jgi:hypothetical protein